MIQLWVVQRSPFFLSEVVSVTTALIQSAKVAQQHRDFAAEGIMEMTASGHCNKGDCDQKLADTKLLTKQEPVNQTNDLKIKQQHLKASLSKSDLLYSNP